MDVSRETSERLRLYVSLIEKWTKAINLVGPSTLADIWDRHIADSVQVYRAVPHPSGLWADLGTGAGLPGLVVAILAADEAPDLRITLVESDKRKATFCRTVVRELGLKANILDTRIEDTPHLGATILSARALAPLTVLLGYAEMHLAKGGTALFPKGADHDREIEEALANWSFSVEKIPSKTDSRSVILKIGECARV